MTERRMFGGLAFMLGGRMFCGVVKDALMVRLGPVAADRALGQPHVRPMDFTGRPMKGMVFVDPAGLRGDALQRWVGAAARYARGLPPKQSAPAARTRPWSSSGSRVPAATGQPHGALVLPFPAAVT